MIMFTKYSMTSTKDNTNVITEVLLSISLSTNSVVVSKLFYIPMFYMKKHQYQNYKRTEILRQDNNRNINTTTNEENIIKYKLTKNVHKKNIQREHTTKWK